MMVDIEFMKIIIPHVNLRWAIEECIEEIESLRKANRDIHKERERLKEILNEKDSEIEALPKALKHKEHCKLHTEKVSIQWGQLKHKGKIYPLGTWPYHHAGDTFEIYLLDKWIESETDKHKGPNDPYIEVGLREIMRYFSLKEESKEKIHNLEKENKELKQKIDDVITKRSLFREHLEIKKERDELEKENEELKELLNSTRMDIEAAQESLHEAKWNLDLERDRNEIT